MKRIPIYLSLLLLITCAKEDSQNPNTPPIQITKQYTLTVSAGDGGSVSTAGGTFSQGTEVSVTATPNSGYQFTSWSNGSTANPLNVTLNSNTSVTANFEAIVNSYTLTVSSGDGGSVSTEGGEYEEGTEVTITATPDEGYEFIGWEGFEENNSTINLTLNNDINIVAIFSEVKLIHSTKIIRIPVITNHMTNIANAFSGRALTGVFAYSYNDESFLFVSGITCGEGECEGANDALDVSTTPPMLLKKQTNQDWVLHEVFENVSTWGTRNSQLYENRYIAIADGNEIGSNPSQWIGHLYFGEINSNSINWGKVTNELNMSFYHDVGIGDLNNDGLMDIIGVPGRDICDPERRRGVDGFYPGCNEYNYNIFYQDNLGNFALQPEKTIIDIPKDNELHSDNQDDSENFGMGYFSIEISDLDNDGFNEIIVSQKFTVVFKYDIDTNIYKLHWFDNHENHYFNYENNGSDYIHAEDINGDGFKDLIIEKPIPQTIYNEGGKSIVTYINNGDSTFSYRSKVNNSSNYLETVAFFINDINNDGFPDLIFKASDGFFSNDGVTVNTKNRFGRGRSDEAGIILNNLIKINNGDGSFSDYDDEILFIPDILPTMLIPYFSSNKLNFIGTRPVGWGSGGTQDMDGDGVPDSAEQDVYIYDIEVKVFD